MKFQVLTYQRLKGTTDCVDPFVAEAIGVPNSIQGIYYYGKTAKEARDKLTKAVQEHLDENYPKLVVAEVEVAPATLFRRSPR